MHTVARKKLLWVKYAAPLGVLWVSMLPDLTLADADLVFLQSTSTTADAITHTFTSQNFGTATPDRCIIIAAHSRKAGAGTTLTDVTIGGVPATIIAQGTRTVTNTNVTGIAAALVPSGTTGDIAVTWGTTMLRAAIGVWRATGVGGCTTPFATSTDIASADPTTTLDIPAGGFAVSAGKTAANTTATWTGLTEQYDAVVESFSGYTGASDEFATVQNDRAITINFGTDSETVGVFASWSAFSGRRTLRLFEGFRIRMVAGRVTLHQSH